MKKIAKKTPYEKFSGKGKISLHEIEEMIIKGGDTVSHFLVMIVAFYNDEIFNMKKVCLHFIDGISLRASMEFLDKYPEIVEPYNKEPNFKKAWLSTMDFEWSDYFVPDIKNFINIIKDKKTFSTDLGQVDRYGELPVKNNTQKNEINS